MEFITLMIKAKMLWSDPRGPSGVLSSRVSSRGRSCDGTSMLVTSYFL
jgi:hypothetical protein